ncbi:hypothetical protein Poli38472_010478 [Pythium oligandrum]|uniref:Probable pectate lyase F n=1 Tax=Pythium oligandrum TaxID=41045 RepID=A0A8K1C379_PYTOL|nr:hypothetical protein Poli38472_010477 [Pythium oligandrum]TMW55596.1 hypothetical protein Poli38472_010478 [Pythium oligandrum]|eukprot:TMW55595.1 hypothetical protein Poli38472_010477 [Pythium oligandrum]
MVQLTSILCAAILAAPALVSGAELPTGSWPASKGTVQLTAPQVVKAGTTFDGGMKTYERKGVTCTGQAEGGKSDAVFLVEAGATLKNVIIGKNQIEGVHCEQHDCTIQNVWWDDVCEDALSIKNGKASSVSRVLGGGARYADDKIIQQNGPGKVVIDGFYAQDFGKLYRSCGNCKTQYERHVEVSNVLAVNPKKAVTMINTNLGDTATISNLHLTSSKSDKTVCVWSKGVTSGEPSETGYGPSKSCIYTAKDVILSKRLLRA